MERLSAIIAASVFSLLWPCRPGFGWGREGHQIVALIAEHYMTGKARAKASELLNGSTIDSNASWADDYRRDHPETGPWHYIDIPLADSSIDLSKECPNADCVVVKTEQFVAVLRDPKADRRAKAEALKYVVHFIGDLHQPLHDEDDNDKGGNTRHVIFDGRPDNTGLLEHINPSPKALAAELESRITPEDREKWVRGSIEDWALEGHRLAQSVAYEDLPNTNPASISPAYERQADPAIELQLEKAEVRLAHVLDHALQ